MALNVNNIVQKNGQKSNGLSVNSQFNSLSSKSFRDKFFISLRKYKTPSNEKNSYNTFLNPDKSKMSENAESVVATQFVQKFNNIRNLDNLQNNNNSDTTTKSFERIKLEAILKLNNVFNSSKRNDIAILEKKFSTEQINDLKDRVNSIIQQKNEIKQEVVKANDLLTRVNSKSSNLGGIKVLVNSDKVVQLNQVTENNGISQLTKNIQNSGLTGEKLQSIQSEIAKNDLKIEIKSSVKSNYAIEEAKGNIPSLKESIVIPKDNSNQELKANQKANINNNSDSQRIVQIKSEIYPKENLKKESQIKDSIYKNNNDPKNYFLNTEVYLNVDINRNTKVNKAIEVKNNTLEYKSDLKENLETKIINTKAVEVKNNTLEYKSDLKENLETKIINTKAVEAKNNTLEYKSNLIENYETKIINTKAVEAKNNTLEYKSNLIENYETKVVTSKSIEQNSTSNFNKNINDKKTGQISANTTELNGIFNNNISDSKEIQNEKSNFNKSVNVNIQPMNNILNKNSTKDSGQQKNNQLNNKNYSSEKVYIPLKNDLSSTQTNVSQIAQMPYRTSNYENVRLNQLPNLMNQITKGLGVNTIHTAKINLKPESLGIIFVEISMNNNEVNIKIKAEMKETLKEIESQISILRENLQQQGVKINKIEIEQNYRESNLNNQDKGENNSQQAEKEEREERKSFIDALSYLKDLDNSENEDLSIIENNN